MTVKRTITSIFMVPTLKIPKDDLLGNGFINGFSKDGQRDEQYKDAIYLLFKPKNLSKFRKFLDSEYDRTKSIIEDYDYQDGYVVVAYKLDPGFIVDFDLVRAGKYSKTSQGFQELFSKTITLTLGGSIHEEVSLQYRIFNKTKDLVEFWEEQFGVKFNRDMEIWDRFDEENETLNLEKVKQDAE